MVDIWRIYRVSNRRHTSPPKLKFVVVVCKDVEYMGFLVNSTISQYILKKPYLYECQVMLSQSDYGFLSHDSYLDCCKIYGFEDDELGTGLETVNDKTKTEIKKAVSASKTIEKKYKDLISSNR